jgi:hypothetical protein
VGNSTKTQTHADVLGLELSDKVDEQELVRFFCPNERCEYYVFRKEAPFLRKADETHYCPDNWNPAGCGTQLERVR